MYILVDQLSKGLISLDKFYYSFVSSFGVRAYAEFIKIDSITDRIVTQAFYRENQNAFYRENQNVSLA